MTEKDHERKLDKTDQHRNLASFLVFFKSSSVPMDIQNTIISVLGVKVCNPTNKKSVDLWTELAVQKVRRSL
jgi:hypothetical protein